MKFYYVYVLCNFENKWFYIGFTDDLQARYYQHHDGKVQSTAHWKRFELIFYEAYRNQYDAIRREKYLKTSKGKTTLKSMLREFLKNIIF